MNIWNQNNSHALVSVTHGVKSLHLQFSVYVIASNMTMTGVFACYLASG